MVRLIQNTWFIATVATLAIVSLGVIRFRVKPANFKQALRTSKQILVPELQTTPTPSFGESTTTSHAFTTPRRVRPTLAPKSLGRYVAPTTTTTTGMTMTPVGNCSLPPNGRWAMANVGRAFPPFWMAVYGSNDIVSQSLLFSHNWEQLNVNLYGRPGHAVDIGGNVGFYTFALAKAGWNVTTFEAMSTNVALMKATLCANPDIVERVDLHEVGLGDSPGRCSLMSHSINVGDGMVVCSANDMPNHLAPTNMVVREHFEVKRFDDQFPKGKFAEQKVDFVKIDVEGFECKVFRGASKLLQQKPRIIQSEVWGTMQGCTPRQYVQLFMDAGYHLTRNPLCQGDVFLGELPKGTAIADYWMCHTGT